LALRPDRNFSRKEDDDPVITMNIDINWIQQLIFSSQVKYNNQVGRVSS
jgi:hypothetical protein